MTDVTNQLSEIAPETGKAEPGCSVAAATRRNRATAVLIFVSLLWGLSFPLMKDWQDAAKRCPGGPILASATLIALRMAIGLLVLIAFRPGLVRHARGRDHAIGLVIGSAFVAGFLLQVVGLAWTTPARSAFITSLGSAWVPLLAWACFRLSVSRVSLFGLALGILGTAVLSFQASKQGTDKSAQILGDGLTLVASMVFAVQILLLDRLGRRAEPGHLSVGFFAVSAVVAAVVAVITSASGPGLDAWLDWTVSMLRNEKVLIELGILIVFPTVLAFHLMNSYQPRVAASRAALIYLLEPVFGAAFSVPWQHDQLGWGLALGGGLILGGNLLVELPIWRPRAAAER